MAATDEHVTMVSASALLKLRAYYYDIGISISKDDERGPFQCERHTLAVMVTR